MMALNTIWRWMLRAAPAAAAEPAKEGDPTAAPTQLPGLDSGSAGTQMTDIHDIKPILDVGPDWQWLLYAAGGIVLLLGLLALAWWLWKRRRTPEVIPTAAPPIAPDAEAYNALDALAAESGLDPKQFYFRLSAVLRRYVERRFDFPAAEMTTEELLPQVDQLPLEPSLAGDLKAFCRESDPIKFAGAAARQERLAQALAFSRDFVRQTTAEKRES